MGKVSIEYQYVINQILNVTVLQSKNHTGRNATHKAHANGIKKAKNYPGMSLKGV